MYEGEWFFIFVFLYDPVVLCSSEEAGIKKGLNGCTIIIIVIVIIISTCRISLLPLSVKSAQNVGQSRCTVTYAHSTNSEIMHRGKDDPQVFVRKGKHVSAVACSVGSLLPGQCVVLLTLWT